MTNCAWSCSSKSSSPLPRLPPEVGLNAVGIGEDFFQYVLEVVLRIDGSPQVSVSLTGRLRTVKQTAMHDT